MIEDPTVFVLGAGAHCAYGFPSGEQLKAMAVTAVRQSLVVGNESSFRTMTEHGAATPDEVLPARCEAFAEALENAGQPSIDAFLNANRHQLGFRAIGMGAIAQVLLHYESQGIPNSGDDWLYYLFKVMLDGVSSAEELIERNKASFITFNYDRLLEMWLFKRIKYSFGLDDEVALDTLRRIPIHHVYGMLGTFPSNSNQLPHAWVIASRGIRTIFDAERDETALDSAKALLASSRKICFLGFGFHRENLQLLGLASYVNGDRLVTSSRYDILGVEWSRLTREFPGSTIQYAHWTYKCLDAMRHLPLF